VRIHCLSTGQVRAKRGGRGIRHYIVDDWADETRPVNVFLIEHEQGLCLFDTGQTARAAKPGYFPPLYPFFRLSRFELAEEDEVQPQLSRLGVDIADIRWVVLSHLHTDHVGGLEPFRDAEVLVSATEWRDAQGLGGRLRGYLPQYWPSAVNVRTVDFAGAGVGPFTGSHDLLGDGSLLLVPTSGHTRGHMSLLVRNADRSFLCGGDAAMNANELHAVAPAIADFCERTDTTFLAAHDWHAPELVAEHEKSPSNSRSLA
jgi:N-acyl homoserine lactone hydrolase